VFLGPFNLLFCRLNRSFDVAAFPIDLMTFLLVVFLQSLATVFLAVLLLLEPTPDTAGSHNRAL
jgi:hypothetical protein